VFRKIYKMPMDDERLEFLVQNVQLLSKGIDPRSLEASLSNSNDVKDFLNDPRCVSMLS
jgi:hypothetical protein